MDKRIFAIVLAAGSASRFGSTKQLAKLDGVSLVARAVATANEACADRTVVVLGHDAAEIAHELQATAGFIVINENFNQGLGTSLARALRSIRHAADAIVVMLADQPGVSDEHVVELMKAWNGGADEIIATAFGGTQGPPVLFASGCFDELQALSGDAGGKHLFNDPQFQFRTIEFEPAAIDIDTPEDLRRT